MRRLTKRIYVQKGVKKGMKLPKLGMKITDIEEFSLGNLSNYIYSHSTQVGELYGTNENLIRCEKRCEIA